MTGKTRLKAVRDRSRPYPRYALKLGDTFQGTLLQEIDGKWSFYFDQERDYWPGGGYPSKLAALRAARRAWETWPPIGEMRPYRKRIRLREALAEMAAEGYGGLEGVAA